MIKQFAEKITSTLAEYSCFYGLKKIKSIYEVSNSKKTYLVEGLSSCEAFIMINHDNINYIEDVLKMNKQLKNKLNEFKTFCTSMLYGHEKTTTINEIRLIKNVDFSCNVDFSSVNEIKMIWPEIDLLLYLKNDSIELSVSSFKSGNYSLTSNSCLSYNVNKTLEVLIDDLKLMMLKEVDLNTHPEDHKEVVLFKNKSFDEVLNEQFLKMKFNYIDANEMIKHINTKTGKDLFDVNEKKYAFWMPLDNEYKKVAVMMYNEIMKEPYRESKTIEQLINLIIFYCDLSNKPSDLRVGFSYFPKKYTKLNKIKELNMYSFYFENLLTIDIGCYEKNFLCTSPIPDAIELKTDSLDCVYTYFLNLIQNHINKTINNDETLTSNHLELYKMIII